MPPRAPACDTKGGINASSTGTATSWSCRARSSVPARMSRIGVSRITAVISTTILRITRSATV